MRLVRASQYVPGLRQAMEYAYRGRFNRATGQVRLFRNIYPNFENATRDIPKVGLAGYDNEASAQRLEEERLRICPFDYPIMFWLAKLLPGCKLLFDWGGNVGISYYGYQKYLPYPDDLKWLVCEVPAVAARGRQIAIEQGASGLQFTTSLDGLAGADVLLAAGVLQFIEEPFQPLVAASKLPTHILINKIPAYGRRAAVTLHNFGSAFCPYHLFNKDEFVGRFTGLGYRLVDEWASPDLGCDIPFFPEHSIGAYTGFYFTKAGAAWETT